MGTWWKLKHKSFNSRDLETILGTYSDSRTVDSRQRNTKQFYYDQENKFTTHRNLTRKNNNLRSQTRCYVRGAMLHKLTQIIRS